MEISAAQILVFILCDTLIKVASLPTGAPFPACSNMVPRHSGTRPQNAETSPFSLSQPAAYFPGQTSSISVKSNDPSRTIRGLLLQARRVGDGVPNGASAIVGTWTLLNGVNDGYRLTQCSNPNDTVTHRTRNSDTEVFFLWQAPEDLTDGIQFMVTVVESFTTYWPQLSTGQVAYPAGQTTEGVKVCTSKEEYIFDTCYEASLPCDSSPCQNEGTCSNNGQLFTCACPAGFEGLLCENEVPRIAPCDSEPCLNGGSCFNLGIEEHSPFFCLCADGYDGMTCQTASSPCDSFPCQNEGTCIDNGQLFICICPGGFEGLRCEKEVPRIAPCDSEPCLNGGSCFNLGIEEHSPFFCLCVDGYDGMTCQTVSRITPCDSQPCLNGGTCFNLGIEEHSPFFCMCADGYDGMTCQAATDPCVSTPCANGGLCFSSENGNMFVCLCVGDFSGPTCETGTDLCVESPCQNGGTCIINDDLTTTRCMCPPGYAGLFCETAVCPEGFCQNAALCRVLNGENKCFCEPGFTGETCETRITTCTSNPCDGGGTCNLGENGEFQCTCPERRVGVRCETVVCPSNYCSNGGSCSVTMETRGDGGERYECSCSPGFTGETCREDIDECDSSPCQNNGHCINGVNQFDCNCQPGFGGTFCEQYCVANFKCLNYGTCVFNEAESTIFCECLPGYTGDRCEIDKDECESNPCQHGSVCMDYINGYQCKCVRGSSPGCENTAAPAEACADADLCPTGSECIDLFDGYYCMCPEKIDDSRCGRFIRVAVDDDRKNRPSGINRPFRLG